ncbi:hypothetical protein PUNSTDRAFT_144847 [Punctularia strigosozonata HHB-11173 SS5]|uniref:uncharacterized protein n=1 Tax=Punctularia strigosozonata (strain HHB-11173) TaxID=741275 RepID=UPI0004416E97|nr:uncharacterized protein PUNSTDRAFT_144847 [Punctularia strigosozonata HHB-11173 SS5]EIN07346.1 hypothetical protein PUNSTDRAFT_144847 [Punctularia strigosozonata HHB-11173 SS5]
MSHQLLLRLFLSPSFFSLHVALRYLRHYSDNIGITYYLTRRLREYDTNELREVWGLICHLLVTRPSKSRALECFVKEICERSTHISMLTLWFMQATLNDLAVDRHNTPSFFICQRTLHQCHELIFGDIPPPVPSPYQTLSLTFRTKSLFARKKVKANVEPALVGLGMVLAGAPGMPSVTEIMGEVAIEQGRLDEEGTEMRGFDTGEDDVATGNAESVLPKDNPDEGDSGENSDGEALTPVITPVTEYADSSTNAAVDRTLSLDGHAVTAARRMKRTITPSAAQTSPALPLHLMNIRRSRMSEDPLGQYEQPATVFTHTPSQSSPSVSLLKPNRGPAADSILSKYGAQTQIHLLRSYYCRSEVQFLLTLESISNRLLVIPRPARVSALRAELTALNHKLPAEVCMPMWCSSSDVPGPPPARIPQPHHRIVRIPPGESVVLNSAERAPYVLILEILNDDLDFDPAKRSNKEILKKIVEKENERKGASHDLVAFARRDSVKGKDVPQLPADGDADAANPEADVDGAKSEFALGEEEMGKEMEGPPPVISAISPTPTTARFPEGGEEEEEEIDLVEQLYGAGHSLRSKPVDLSDSVVLPAAPKNRDLDMAAWSSSNPVTPAVAIQGSSAFARAQTVPNTVDNGLSMDEYAQRMRTAAVMLAQLNASMMREPVTTAPVPGAPHASDAARGWSSWIPGGTTAEASAAKGPVHPTLANAGPRADPAAPQMRMKLQPAEATAIRERIMKEMLALEEERMARMRERENRTGFVPVRDIASGSGAAKSAEDEGIIRRELDKADPSAAVFSESWTTKKSRIRQASPYGHLASWDCVSVIVKTGGDLRQEQFAVQLIQEFGKIWRDENCPCWVRHFQILITGATSAIVETITDAVSIHSIKKAEYARRLAEGGLGHVTLLDHFKNTYGDPGSAKFARAQRNFAKSLAGYSVVTYLLQIKDRHNGNILLDRDGHLIHIDFGFMLSNSPGNIGFEAAPFKLPLEYVDVLGGVDGDGFKEFRRLFREGFEAARKHCDRIVTMVELMQKDSNFPCFAALGEQTAVQLRDRFMPTMTHTLVGEHIDRLIDTSLGSHWTRLYDSYQYYSQSIL